MKSAHRSARAVTVALVVTLSMTLAGGNALAATSTPTSTSSGISTTATRSDADDAFDELERRLSAVPENASAEEAARIIYPNDSAAQAEYIALAQKVDQAAREFQARTSPNDRVIPAILRASVPVLGKCVMGALTSVGAAEVIRLVGKGQHLTANDMVEGALAGCILSLPSPLRPIANAAKPHIVAAITAIIIRFGPK